MNRLHLLASVALLLLASCGTSGSNPCQGPAEVNFSIQGTSGTPFHVVSFTTGDGAVHLFGPPDAVAPHTFYLINTNYPVTGTFMRSPDATEDVPVFLRPPDVSMPPLATGVIPFTSDAVVPLQTPMSLTGTACPVPKTGPEIRLEIFTENTLAFNVPFVLTVGDEQNSFLACGVNRVCGTPSTVYFDNARKTVDAIITKSVDDDQVIDLQLYVDNRLEGTDRATHDNRTAKVHVEF